jgi:NADH:ubiquinone oxidoreductase subunit
MNLLEKIKIKFFCKKVGNDEFGNEYYQNPRSLKKYVVYKGIAEASKIPPNWHSWIHGWVNDTDFHLQAQYFWQKIHLPNLTGTKKAYRQEGHLAGKASRGKVSSDYQPWKPNN